MPLFSTIRIRLRLRDDQSITDVLDREGKILKTMSSDDKDRLLQTTREDALKKYEKFSRISWNSSIKIVFTFVLDQSIKK
jgi:hypothetical protein